MIIVGAVLVPHGDLKNGSVSLGYLEIINDGTGTLTRRNYDVIQYSRGKKPRVIKRTRIERWPSKAKTAFALVQEAFRMLDRSRLRIKKRKGK